MNDFLYNRKTAYICVFLMVLVSIFILGGNDLRNERMRVINAVNGQNELSISVTAEASIVLANSANLLVVAGRYIDTEDNRILNIRNFLDDPVTGHSNLSDWEINLYIMGRVMPYVRRLLGELSDMNIESRSAEQLTEIEINIDAALRRIDLSGYNALADDFNRLLRNPYTGMIATVRGIRGFLMVRTN